MKPILVLTLLLLFMTCLLVRSHAANTYYVSSGITYGNATNVPAAGVDNRNTNVNSSGYNRGTIQYPFRTIQYAAKQVVAGDTVIVRDGLYSENVYIGLNSWNGVVTSQSGANGAQIAFRAEHTGLAYVQGSATYDGCFNIKSADQSDLGWSSITNPIGYIDIRGFDLQSTGYDGKGVSITWGYQISIRDCKIHDCGAGGITTAYSDYLYFESNTITNCCRTSTYNSSGISLWLMRPRDNYMWPGGYHNVIKRNTCYNNYIAAGATKIGTTTPINHTDGNGIIIDTSRLNVSMLIDDNLIYNNGGRGIINDGSANVDILNNTCYNNCTDTEVGGKEEIFLHNVTWGTGPENTFCSNVLIRDNICWPGNGKQCIQLDSASQNITVTNNWLYSGSGYSGNGSGSTTLIKYGTLGSTWTISGNYGAGEPNAGGNPLFVSPGTSPTSNFHLQSGSGCKDKSVSHPQYDRDYYARPYNSAWDLGAYEYHP